ncbi:high frequency lysogenization protein HflD [Stutzerimonas tarimensis]|uniref:High frequency lysogenization protein HflD homolog n=1 Tax=Stutzerimonas tarimensis TaxID=1507735 RepID=A0ABV7T0S9_9GAMM
MHSRQEQLIALGAVFEAAVLVDRIAHTGQIPSSQMACMLGSLLVRNPESTQEIYGGDDINLRDGYRALAGALERDATTLQRDPLRYALAMISLERQLDKRGDLLQVIAARLDQIQRQADLFGLPHENVVAAFGGLYQDTLSTFRQRIQVQGDMRHLQQSDKAAAIRALLLSGIRSARLWRQLGGHRWQMVFGRRKLLEALQPMLRS